MKKLNYLAVACLFAVSALFASCKDDDNENFKEFTLTNDTPLVISNIVVSNDEAYPVSFQLEFDNATGNLVVKGLPTELDRSLGLPTTMEGKNTAQIAYFGKAKKLSKVDKYPAASEFDATQKASIESGYVVEAHGTLNLSATYPTLNAKDPGSVYMRIALLEEVDNGFKIKYEVPFIPEE